MEPSANHSTTPALPMAHLVARAPCSRPWQIFRHTLLRQNLLLPCRYESSSSESETLFPWRHSPEPIKRVLEKDNLSGLPIAKQNDTFFHQVMLGSMLQRDWYELLMPSVWKESLADDCAWAFQKGVSALLSRVFQVPIGDIDKEDLGIIFDSENPRQSKTTIIEEDESKSTGKGDTTKEMSGKDASNDSKEESVQEEEELCSLMLQKKLIELYANVDPSTTDLLLCMNPISSKLENVFSVIFTREAVEDDAELAEKGRSMRYASRVTRDPLEVNRMLKDLDKKGKPIAFFTIIADVSIQCLEAFRVKEKSTGQIVTGSTEPQEVTHLVRLEVTTNLDGGPHLGSWRIVDWDDLLEGNVWY